MILTPTAPDLAAPADRLLEMMRLVDAPRGLVYAAWTERAHLIHWSAPQGFAITHSEGDLRPGGAWRACMRSPDGVDHWVSGVYREVVPAGRLVFTHAWDGKDGRPGHETLVTVTLADACGGTLMTFRQGVFKSPESRDGHEGAGPKRSTDWSITCTRCGRVRAARVARALRPRNTLATRKTRAAPRGDRRRIQQEEAE